MVWAQLQWLKSFDPFLPLDTWTSLDKAFIWYREGCPKSGLVRTGMSYKYLIFVLHLFLFFFFFLASEVLLMERTNYSFTDIIINTFQDPLGLLMPCCAVPPEGTRAVEIPLEDQGL